MYVELTPEDTLRDLQVLLIDAIPGFEFPRVNLYDYEIKTAIVLAEDLQPDDFTLGVVWSDMDDGIDEDEKHQRWIVEYSTFNCELNSEEINILATLMMIGWVQRQVTSIENTRMKYSGSDFKMTSQANHLSKLLSLLSECKRQSHHMQRLYKRRKLNHLDGRYSSNWANALGRGVYYVNKNYPL